jgi:hypothetical protein
MKPLYFIALIIIFSGASAYAQTAKIPFIDRALKAIAAADYETIEGLRGEIKPEHIPVLVSKWKKTLPWEQKDAFIMLLMDQQDDKIMPVMRDGLDSPTIENRAAALCILKKDFNLHNTLYDKNGWVIAKKVEEEVAKYKKRHPKN